MLKYLKVQNIALVVEAELFFDKGLTVLTGETGAGKSIIVTALSLALGERADRDYIRHGAERATVEAAFMVSTLSGQYKKEYAEHIDDNQILVLRELSRDGSSRIKVNNVLCSLSRLKELMAPVAEILGQHANQMLMEEDNHLLFLDHFAGVESQREGVRSLYQEWDRVAAELRKTLSRREQLSSERELAMFQRAEIEKANVKVGEEEELLNEKRMLDSARTLMASAAGIQEILDGEEMSAVQQVRMARRELDKLAAIDKTLENKVTEMTDFEYRLQDMRQFFEEYGAGINDDPARLEEINERLEELYRLKKKYGGSEEAILQTLELINKQLGDVGDIDSLIAKLEKEKAYHFAEYTRHARELSEVRHKAAEYLSKLTIKELGELAIDKGEFYFDFEYEDDPEGVDLHERKVRPFPHGLENGKFMFSANPGEPAKSLVKTASGGEISRVLLALKAAEKKSSSLMHSLLVFDEVDTGIGGMTASEVGKKLKRLADKAQVLVVTHLHQIARQADHHFVAEKMRKPGGRATIQVRDLNPAGIQEELARMVALPEE